jgi:hypothetical protein
MKNCLDTREAASSLRIISAALAEAQSIVELALAIVTGGGTVFTGIALAV